MCRLCQADRILGPTTDEFKKFSMFIYQEKIWIRDPNRCQVGLYFVVVVGLGVVVGMMV